MKNFTTHRIALISAILVFLVYFILYKIAASDPSGMNIGSGIILLTYFAFGWLDDSGFRSAFPYGDEFPIVIVAIVAVIFYILTYTVVKIIKFFIKLSKGRDNP